MIFSAVFLVSAILFALGALQTRLFSFSSWYHMTYMIVAVTLMGYAAAGTVLAIKKSLKNYERSIHINSILFAVSIPIAFFAASKVPVDPMMPNKFLLIGFVFLDYLFLFLPHFFGGLILLSIFQNNSKNVNISCFFSILGLIAGCAAAIPLLETLGMEGTLAVISVAAAFVSLFIAFSSKRGKASKAFSALLIVLAAVLFPFKESAFVFSPAGSKMLAATGIDPEMTEWNRIGRVDISATNGLVIPHQWEDLRRGVITVDGDAPSFIYDFSEVPARVALSLCSAGYFGLQKPDVFLAGLSATDIAAALFWKAGSVTSVETNKALIDLSVKKYADFKDNILQNGKVSIIHGEVREFLMNSERKFDLIQLPGTDNVSALLNGVFIMSESYLYTKEAFMEYFKHLKDDGTLSVVRQMLWPPRETLRVAVTAAVVLKEMGVEHPENNVVIIGDGRFAATIAKKRPFTWTELNEIAETIAATKDYRIIYAPGFKTGARYYDPVVTGMNFSADQAVDFIKSGFGYFFDSLENGRENEFIADYPYDITPVSDDKPFFFNYFKFGGDELPTEVRNVFVDRNSSMLPILFFTVVQLLFLLFSMLVTPVFFMSKEEKKFLPHLQIPAFVAIGSGFMFIGMSFIQKFTLIFGDPATSALYAIGTLLSFSALGALFGKKILIASGEKLFFSVLAIVLPLMILGYAVAMPRFTAFCAGCGFALKLCLAALFVSPLGFAMGVVFPVSLLLVGEKKPFFIPLACSAEVAASIFAGVISAMIAFVYGFRFVFVLSAFFYFFALSAMLYFVKKKFN